MVNHEQIHRGSGLTLAAALACTIVLSGIAGITASHADEQKAASTATRAEDNAARDRAANQQTKDTNARNDAQNDQSNQGGQSNQNDAFTIKPEALTFGQRPLFTSHTESFWLKNKGKSALKIAKIELQGANEPVFKLQHNCGTSIAVEGECRINVTFEPTSDGDKTAEVHVVAGDNSVRTKTVKGVGVKAQFSVSTESVAFGKVERNSGSTPQTVTIKNTGTVALPITATSLGGPNEHQFSQSNDCPAELGVGKTCASTIVFRPTDQGQKTATLTVWAKGGAAEKKIAISGTGA
jgi:hypothetical protein